MTARRASVSDVSSVRVTPRVKHAPSHVAQLGAQARGMAAARKLIASTSPSCSGSFLPPLPFSAASTCSMVHKPLRRRASSRCCSSSAADGWAARDSSASSRQRAQQQPSAAKCSPICSFRSAEQQNFAPAKLHVDHTSCSAQSRGAGISRGHRHARDGRAARHAAPAARISATAETEARPKPKLRGV